MSRGITDELSGFINRSSLPSSGRPTDIIRTDQVKLSSLTANSRIFDFNWTDDGKQLLLSRGEVTSDVVLLSNLR